MVESGGGGGSKPTSSYESSGDRLRFTVELRPGETTIVSWRKLLKEATSKKPNGGPVPSVSFPSTESQQQPVSQPQHPPPAVASSKEPAENEVAESEAQPGSNRLSTVIEKIERMYAGNGSSEEEDLFLDDVPDDDEYDTEDSFIDDAELDDYFQVDNLAIKHDGFFVNRGKLERVEPAIPPNQQPKKRRRKDVTKGQDGNDDAHNPNKHVKVGNKGRKTSSSIGRISTSQLNRVAVANLHSLDMLFEASLTNAAEVSVKNKTADSEITVYPLGPSNVDGIRQNKDADQQKTGVLSSESHNTKLKESSRLQDTSAQRSNDKSSHVSKSHSGKQLINADEMDQTIQRKEKGGLVERFDLNVPASRDSLQITKVPLMLRKEGSNVRPKITMLDKAIRELEKIVAESRPPSTELQDPDNSSQSVKRRLPPEIKQKLAKVARLVQAIYGKIPMDVINRLMSIVGHLMQLRTLKRNLKVMASLGLSAKQEKDNQLQKIKQEVVEMVRQRILHMKSKVEQQTTDTDDFQEAGPEEALKQKHSMDDVLENKICDLYELYVERLEEDSGPPVRRLYEELSALWPSGVMGTVGIKRAIYKAKERRRALSGRQKDQDKIRRKKVLAPKAEDTIPREGINVNSSLHIHKKSLPDFRDHASPMTGKPVQSAAVTQAAATQVTTIPFANVPNMNKPKQEKAKGPIDAMPIDVLPKKKVKRKPNSEMVEAQFNVKKVVVSQVEERHTYHKQVTVPFPTSNLQPGASSGTENLS